MTADNTTTPVADEDVRVFTGEAGPKLGNIVVTPAALALLEMQGLKPQYVLQFHECIEGAALDALDEAVSHPEIGPCKPVRSLFETEYGPILVRTSLRRGAQNRVTTRVMLPKPAPAKRP